MWLALIILVSWLLMALESPTKALRNRRLILIGVIVLFALVMRYFHATIP